jgi:ATP-binding cassette subfamily F protein 3
MDRLRQQKRDQDDEIERMQAFINRFRYQATKASQVQSRIKMLDKIVRIEIPPDRKRVRFHFPQTQKSGRMVMELKHVRKAYGATRVFGEVNLHIERGDRIALVGPNGAGKSTLMRMLSGVEAPDSGERVEGHQMVMQYFAQDEAAKLDPSHTVYTTLAGDSPIQMVPHIRTILGGFLFSGDDIDKPVRVLSGGERTRLAVARMLLRPANTLLLDEPTNHLDLDSKDVLLEALEDFGGTLIFVSHDRYFVDKLATKIIEIGHGDASVYPGTYEEFLWSKTRGALASPKPRSGEGGRREAAAPGQAQTSEAPGSAHLAPRTNRASAIAPRAAPASPRPRSGEGGRPQAKPSYADKKEQGVEARRVKKDAQARQRRIQELEARIAKAEAAIKEVEAEMSAPGFYENHTASKPVIDRHQALMWEVGDLMNKWEALQAQTEM